MLEISDLHSGYGSSVVLRGVDSVESLGDPEALLDMPALRRVVTAVAVLPEALAMALEARGVTVATHPLRSEA